MKITIQIGFGYPDLTHREISDLLRSVKLKSSECDISEFLKHVDVVLPLGDARLVQLKEALIRKRIKFSSQRDVKFAKADVKKCDFLYLAGGYSLKLIRSVDWNASFNTNTGCSRCGTGSEQQGSLVLQSGVKLASRMTMVEFDGITLLRDDVISALAEIMDVASCFRKVEILRSAPSHPWWQIVTKYTAPPMLPTESGLMREGGCEVCSQDGFYFDSASKSDVVCFSSSALAHFKQSALWASWERFGESFSGHAKKKDRVASPIYFVSNDFAKVIWNMKLKEIGFVPMVFS